MILASGTRFGALGSIMTVCDYAMAWRIDRVTKGKTAELVIEQARKLFRSIDTSHVVASAIAPCSACWPIPEPA